MTREEFVKLYWRQYLSLERDLIDTDDYVSINKKNYAVFSNNYAKLFTMICSEIDSLSVEFCNMIKKDYKEESAIKNNNIIKRIDTIKIAYPKLSSKHIMTKFPFDEINFEPFKKFTKDEAAEWWQDYNNLKHRRAEVSSGGKYYYEKANLKNTIISLSALYLLCFLMDNYFEVEEDNIISESKMFTFVG